MILLLNIWLNRHCKKCQQVKCIERIFNKLCQKCQGQKPQPKKQTYEL
ncbi:MAG: hypothetical protein MRERV_78c009 [Mycoplasmataceae bacterium RV_VA103A]|nr:MAG: hypothetical protein MRERV_78c009 [Mycoplasmataceae bacterium RV_VA103A]